MAHCQNCGQKVAGKVARLAADPEVQYCWKCGAQLDDEGKCETEECPFCGKKPPAPPF